MTDVGAVSSAEPQDPLVQSHKIVIDLAIIALIGLAVQGFWVWQVTEPTYMDSYYYATNGQRLAAGKGFTELVIWQYLDSPDSLPVPSHTYWMPLPSMIAAAGYAIWNDFRGAQLLFWLLGGLLPLLTYAICFLLRGERWQNWVAALFTVAGGYYAAFLAQPTTFAPFAWAGATCLLFTGLAISNSRSWINVSDSFQKFITRQRLWLFLAGIVAGIAHLARADGLLLLIIAILIWLFHERMSRDEPGDGKSDDNDRESLSESTEVSLTAGLLLILAGYLVIMGIWLFRNWSTTGFPLPAGGTQSLFLTSYDDLFAYGRELDFSSFIEWGWINIFMSRLQGLSINLQTYFAVVGLIFLAPFVIIGFIRSYRNSDQQSLLRPVFWYAISLFLIMSLLFTFPGTRGSLFHSSVALWPWSMALAALGIGTSIDWVSKRLSHWQPEKAKLRFSAMFVIIAFLLSFVISWPRSQIREDSDLFRQIANDLPEDAVVMAGNAPSVHYHTGRAAINVPNEPPDVLVEVAERYGASYLILDENRPQPLVDLYHGKENHPGIKLIEIFESIKLYQLDES
jgi:hypothetical protein